MRIGDCVLSRDRTLTLLIDYAVPYSAAVDLYDLGGDLGGRPGPCGAAEPADSVTLADIGRLVVINAALAAEDVATLIDVDAAGDFAVVPAEARMQECEPGGALDHAATPSADVVTESIGAG